MTTQGQVEDRRLQLLHHWLENELGLTQYTLAPASADASFRRYFRLTQDGDTRIIMDAPPGKEDIHPFINIAALLRSLGLNAPEVMEQNLEQGFLLLSDLGQRDYLSALNEASVEQLYGDALQALFALQACSLPTEYPLPPYDLTRLMNEMGLFRDWYLGRHLRLEMIPDLRFMLDEVFSALADNALQQPQVCVHRDYHSRNLMLCEPNPGVIDFQDAVLGPVTYDLVSLLRDCYIAWPRERVEGWVAQYHATITAAGRLDGVELAQFLHWFDLMGVQRHLKATGIFARLNYRDAKPGYLADIPRTMGYVKEVCARYTVLQPLGYLVEELEARGEQFLPPA